MTKRVFIIHGWQGSPNGNWFPWLKERLGSRGFVVSVPEMPNPDYPELSQWIKKITEVVSKPDNDTYLIGHSLGCIAILRYLEGLKTGKIGGSILVAGFTDDLDVKELSDFFINPINWEKINSHCSKFVAVASDNDPYVSLKYSDILNEKLNAKVLIQHGMGHFNMKELHVVLNEVLKMSA